MDSASRRSQLTLPQLTLPLVASLLVYLAHALSYRFVCDDAFISFRYARNLIEHGEFVFNVGERVEGISNPLWTLLMAAGLSFGLDPVPWSQGIGVLCGLAVLLRVHGWMRQRCARPSPLIPSPSDSSSTPIERRWSDLWSVLPVLLLAAAPGFAAWTTGGLETPLFTLLVTLAWTDWWRERALLAGFWIGLAGLTRPEGLVLLVPLVLHGLLVSRRGSAMVRLVGGAAVMTVPALLARHAYYGQWLPNTVHAKAPAAELLPGGLFYLWRWIHTHGLVVLPIAGLWLWRPVLGRGPETVREARSMLVLALAVLIVFSAVVVSVGGDFMVLGRYLVPLLPLLAVVLAWGAERRFGGRWRQAGERVGFGTSRRAVVFLLVFLGCGAVHRRAVVLESYTSRGLASIGWLTRFVRQGEVIGEWLRASQAPDTRIAITAAGTIPYASNLWTLDMLGLNDAWIARNAEPEGTRPGHRMHAPLDYLLSVEPDLIVAHPTITDSPSWPAAGMREAWAKRGFEWKSIRVPRLEPEWFGYWQRVE